MATVREQGPKRFFRATGILFLVLSTLVIPAVPAQEKNTMTPYDRVERARARGQLSDVEALMLKAKLLFAREAIPKDSPFAPQAGETAVPRDCLTGFYKEVHHLKGLLSREDREFLKSVNTDLKFILEKDGSEK
jgi:hypothetical protein